MGVEEQKEEREVLDSIFPDEITGIAPLWNCCCCFRSNARLGVPRMVWMVVTQFAYHHMRHMFTSRSENFNARLVNIRSHHE